MLKCLSDQPMRTSVVEPTRSITIKRRLFYSGDLDSTIPVKGKNQVLRITVSV